MDIKASRGDFVKAYEVTTALLKEEIRRVLRSTNKKDGSAFIITCGGRWVRCDASTMKLLPFIFQTSSERKFARRIRDLWDIT